MQSKRYTQISLVILIVVIALLLAYGRALAQAGEEYDLSWWTIDGGGVAVGKDAILPYSLSGTVGQPDAGHTLSNEGYILTGGFWAGAESAIAPGANIIYLPLVLKN